MAPTGPPGCILQALFFPFLTVQVCRIQISSHTVLYSVSPQEYAKPISKSLPFTFPNPYPHVLQQLDSGDVMKYLQRKSFSPVIFSFLFLFFGGEWFLRMSFDILYNRVHPLVSITLSFSSLSLSLCVSLSFWLFFASFSFLVSGSRPPLNRCKTREVWSLRRALVVPPSLPARPS